MHREPTVSVDLFEQMEQGVSLHDADGRFLYLNPAAERLVGARRETALGRIWWEVFPELVGQPAHAAFERVARGGAPESVEHFHAPEERWFGLRFLRMPEGVCIMTTDITARRKAEAERDAVLARVQGARQQAETRMALLEEAFASAPMLLCLVRGPEHTCVLANAPYQRLMGQRELIGRPMRDVLPELEGQGFFRLLDRVYQTGEPYIGREELTRIEEADGRLEERYFTFVYQPTRGPEGQVDGILGVAFDVTAQVEARRHSEALAEALAAREAEARAIVDTLHEAVVVHDAQGRVVKANASAERMLGLGQPRMAERDSADARWGAVREDGSPFPGEAHPAMEALRTGQPQSDVVMGVMNPDGRRVWLSVNAQPLPGPEGGPPVGAVASFTDFTQRRRAEQALRFLSEATVALASTLDSHALLGTLSRLAVPGFADWCSVYLRQEDGGTVLAAVTSQSPEVAVLVRELHRLYPQPPDAPHVYRHVMRTGQSELVAPITSELLEAAAWDETHRRMLLALAPSAYLTVPLSQGPRVLGAIVFGLREPGRTYDAQDQAVAEELARRAAIAFEQARLFELAQAERRRAEEASRLKDEFLATVSHELRTPLTAMLGWMQLLRTGRLSAEKQARALETVERNTRVQAQLVEDLLDVSRIISGKLRLELGPMELADAVRGALEVVRPAAKARGVRLRATLDPEASPFVGDPHRLRQVVWNLLSNAVKFTPEGGRVDVRLRREGASSLIEVEDTGQGIGPDFLPHVFERFRQAEGGTTRRHSGLGLGLAIVKHLVELHGGQVEARSEGEGRGASFTVRLPASQAGAGAGRPEHADGPSEEGLECPSEVKGLRVLVVDDEEDVRELVLSLLDRCEMRVKAVGRASEALEVLVAERPDVLVCDIGMPEEDGYTFIRRVRQLPPESGGRTPAVALTAYSRAEDRMRALLSGYQMHLPKPIQPRELVATLALLTGRHTPAPS